MRRSTGLGSTEQRPPTREELAQAAGRTIPDVIAPGLRVLFCGINPGLYSAATGHHFARPGNRFWPALHLSRFTDRQLRPWEEHLLLERGLGVTNLVARGTAGAAELTREELREGRRILSKKVRRYRPQCVAVLGIGAFRTGFQRPHAEVGRQAEDLDCAWLWVLPNTSGINANHQLPDLVAAFRALNEAVAPRSEPPPEFPSAGAAS